MYSSSLLSSCWTAFAYPSFFLDHVLAAGSGMLDCFPLFLDHAACLHFQPLRANYWLLPPSGLTILPVCSGVLERSEPVPFRLTRNLQTFFTPFGVEGVFITAMAVAAQVRGRFVCPSHVAHSLL